MIIQKNKLYGVYYVIRGNACQILGTLKTT